MKRFYFSRIRVKECLRGFLRDDVIATHNPKVRLSHVYFLNVQIRGNSQRALLSIVDEILREDYGCSIAMCGTVSIETCVYIDDCIFTGNRLRYDLTGTDSPAWITRIAPPYCRLLIYTGAMHTEGKNYAERFIMSAANEKGITVQWRCSLSINTSRSVYSTVEFLWPEGTSNDPIVSAYISNLRAFLSERGWSNADLFRYYGVPAQETLFSSPQARRTVERAFLKKGVQIISAYRRPAESMRPLGFIKIGSLGFGTFFVTYRNIANNCPLVLWWSLDNWYPLFPRIPNQ